MLLKKASSYNDVAFCMLFGVFVVTCNFCVYVTDVINRTEALRTMIIDYALLSCVIVCILTCIISAKVRG